MSSTPRSTLKVPNPLIFSPAEDDIKREKASVTMKNAKLFEIVNTNQEACQEQLHANRLKTLRKELDYLKETAWKYEPIEKYMGQSTQ